MCRNGTHESSTAPDALHTSAERVKRLKTLVQLRKLYRNLLRAERLLLTASPVHKQPEEVKPNNKGSQALHCHLPLATCCPQAQQVHCWTVLNIFQENCFQQACLFHRQIFQKASSTGGQSGRAGYAGSCCGSCGRNAADSRGVEGKQLTLGLSCMHGL